MLECLFGLAGGSKISKEPEGIPMTRRASLSFTHMFRSLEDSQETGQVHLSSANFKVVDEQNPAVELTGL